MTVTLKLLSSMAPREALAAGIALYQHTHPVAVAAEAAGGVEVARRVAAGESVDIVVLSDDAIEKLIGDGQLAREGRVDLMSSRIAVAVPAGAPHPSLANESAVRAAVADAAAVSYSTGPSGRYLERLFARWGILEQLRARLIVPPPGVPVARLIARGEVSLGFQQLSELLDVPGIDIVGPLPGEIQQVTIFAGAYTRGCGNLAAARDLLAFLASPELEPLRQRHGMAAP